MSTLQQQQNPLQFHPVIWFDDEISLPVDNNDNREDLNQFIHLDSGTLLDPDSVYVQYRVPQLPTVELEEPINEGLEFEDNIRDNNRNINNNFDQEADFLSDYITLLSGMYLFQCYNQSLKTRNPELWSPIPFNTSDIYS